LFFCVNSPENIARNILGEKNIKPEMVHRWKKEHFYHLPTFLNTQDNIFHFCAPNSDKTFTSQLDAYKITIVEITQTSIDLSLTTSLFELKKQIKGNSIFIINPIGLKKEIVDYLKAQFLGYGLPYVLIQTSEISIDEYSNSIIAVLKPDKIKPFCDSMQVNGFDCFKQTLFFQKAVQLFWFQFGKSDRNNMDIKDEILNRMGPSMMITVPSFIFGILLNIFISMIIAYSRGSLLDRSVLFICIFLMSMSSLFYIIFAQYLFAFAWKLFPASGYQEGFDATRFILLPICIALISGIGGGVRFYRTLFLEEINKDFVRTARSKGLSEFSVLFKHTLKSAMIPILTGVVVAIPALFTGSLLVENFFSIPGLGAFTLEGIEGQDFRIVGSMVYLGAFMYVIALILTDIAYTIVDPRVKLK
jgi:peptide/nickel transport system permease protein